MLCGRGTQWARLLHTTALNCDNQACSAQLALAVTSAWGALGPPIYSRRARETGKFLVICKRLLLVVHLDSLSLVNLAGSFGIVRVEDGLNNAMRKVSRLSGNSIDGWVVKKREESFVLHTHAETKTTKGVNRPGDQPSAFSTHSRCRRACSAPPWPPFSALRVRLCPLLNRFRIVHLDSGLRMRFFFSSSLSAGTRIPLAPE